MLVDLGQRQASIARRAGMLSGQEVGQKPVVRLGDEVGGEQAATC